MMDKSVSKKEEWETVCTLKEQLPQKWNIHAFASFLKCDFNITLKQSFIFTAFNEKYKPSNIEEHIHIVKVLGQGLHLVFVGNINNFGFDP